MGARVVAELDLPLRERPADARQHRQASRWRDRGAWAAGRARRRVSPGIDRAPGDPRASRAGDAVLGAGMTLSMSRPAAPLAPPTASDRRVHDDDTWAPTLTAYSDALDEHR